MGATQLVVELRHTPFHDARHHKKYKMSKSSNVTLPGLWKFLVDKTYVYTQEVAIALRAAEVLSWRRKGSERERHIDSNRGNRVKTVGGTTRRALKDGEDFDKDTARSPGRQRR